MKLHIQIFTVLLLVLNSCEGQEKKEVELTKKAIQEEIQRPKGNWKVDREFDENGNLIHYDSIYSWSSDPLDDLSSLDRDSLLSNLESKFYNHYSQFKYQGFEDLFDPDSIFSKQFFTEGFFTSDFGADFMELDRNRKRMMERQMEFLEKYRANLGIKTRDSL